MSKKNRRRYHRPTTKAITQDQTLKTETESAEQRFDALKNFYTILTIGRALAANDGYANSAAYLGEDAGRAGPRVCIKDEEPSKSPHHITTSNHERSHPMKKSLTNICSLASLARSISRYRELSIDSSLATCDFIGAMQR